MKQSKNFYKKKLKNGITVLFEKRELPIVGVALATKFGSGYEDEQEKGIAHFIEHMLFKGTKTKSTGHIIDSIDEKGGEYNAFTAKTFTTAYIRIASKHLAFSVELLSDMFYNSVFDEKEIQKERGAIIEEINMYHDNPMRHVFEELNKLMFDKPFGLPALGTKEGLLKLTRKDLFEKYKENYFTSNFVLTIVGNADFEDIIKLAEKYFPKQNKQNKKAPKIKEKNGLLDEKRKELEQAHLVFGVHFPSLKNNSRYAAEIFSSIFAEGMASKVFKEVRAKRGLAYAVLGSYDQEADYGQELVYIGTVKDKIELVKKIVPEEFEKMEAISEKELEKAKNKLIDARDLEKEDSRNVLLDLLFEEVAGSSEEYYKYKEKIEKVKLEEIKKLSKIKNYSFVSLA